jgi:hypothetical protein
LVGGLDEHFLDAAHVVAERIVRFGSDYFGCVQHVDSLAAPTLLLALTVRVMLKTRLQELKPKMNVRAARPG